MTAAVPVTTRRILAFWTPLAATWLMMSVEGPFLAALIARLAAPRENLAAYGVAFALALIVESPIIMMLSASTALVDSREAYLRLRNFTWMLNAALTGLLLLLLLTPLWEVVALRGMGLPAEVARLTRGALLLLLPWPAAIGHRRFRQGLLIRQRRARRVTAGTGIRLIAMLAAALALGTATGLPGAWVGAVALSAGVVAECLASHAMSRGVVRALPPADASRPPLPVPGYREIGAFYAPLALTSLISMAAHPLVTFFMGRGRFPLESLAVLPVVNSLVFLFRSLGLAYQEVAITLLAAGEANRRPVYRFAAGLAAAGTLGLAAVAFTPLSAAWLQGVSGLSTSLAAFAVPPLRLLAVMPALSVLLSLQRAILVHGRRTGPVTAATALEMAGILAVLVLGLGWLPVPGVNVAAAAFLVGRMAGNLYLVRPCLRASGDRLV